MSKQKRKRTSRREHPANPSQHLATDDDKSTPTTQTNTPRNVKGSGVNPLVIAGGLCFIATLLGTALMSNEGESE